VSDEIRLTLPRDRDLFRVAHLVVGGLAVRLDLTLEHLEDLQLALAELLEERDGEGTVTVAVRIDGETLRTRIGPVDGRRLRDALAGGSDDELGIGRVLTTVADDVRIEGDEVELVKTVQRAAS
jgi:anti-sigma regulatory factor (Ser/Thr protein kinase)